MDQPFTGLNGGPQLQFNEKGSSSSRMVGSTTSARAKPTRCRMPPTIVVQSDRLPPPGCVVSCASGGVRGRSRSGAMRSNSIPKGMLATYERIVGLTDDVCDRQLNSEYRDLAGAMTGALCRKRPSPLTSGQPRTLGGRDRLRFGTDQFSRRPFVSSVHNNGRSVRRIRGR